MEAAIPYDFPEGTQIGAFFYGGSGTPVTTYVNSLDLEPLNESARRIARFYSLRYDDAPSPDDPISIDRSEFVAAYQELAAVEAGGEVAVVRFLDVKVGRRAAASPPGRDAPALADPAQLADVKSATAKL